MLSFNEVLNIYLDEGQINDFMRSPAFDKNSAPIENVNLLDPQFIVARRIQIENLITITERELPKVKYVDLFIMLAKQSINLGLLGLAEDVLGILLKKTESIEKLKDYNATAHFYLGEIFFRQGYWKKAESEVNKAKKIYQAEKDRTGVFKCENLLAAILGEKGDMQAALKCFNKAMQNINPKKEKYLQAMLDSNLGVLYQALHNFDESVTYLNRALVYFEQINDLSRIAELKYNIANLYYLKKDYYEALDRLDTAISAASAAENLSMLCLCMVTKSDCYVNLNDLTLANALINYTMEVSCRINDRLSIAEVYKIKGKIELEQRNLDYAETLLLTSLRLNRELENKYNLAETYLSLSKLYKLKKNGKKSAKYQIMALMYFNEVNIQTDAEKILKG